MASSIVSVDLSVIAATDSGEVVCVVGNVPQLGSWKPSDVQILQQRNKTDDGKDVWSATFQLPADQAIQYRFLKAYIRPAKNGQTAKDVMITSWECHITPRCLRTSGSTGSPDVATFGINMGDEKVDRGWLTSHTEIHLRLHSTPITIWKGKYRHQTYTVKCTEIDLRHGEDEEEGEETDEKALTNQIDEESNPDFPAVKDTPPTTVSVLRDSLMVPHAQPTYGTIYKENDYMVFRAQTFNPDAQGYRFDIFICHPSMNDSDTPKHIGTSYLLPMNLDLLTGSKTMPIVGLHHKPIGHLTVEYLIVKPLAEDACDMSVSYARFWSSKRTIDVGHRGLGATHHSKKNPVTASPKRCETIMENTIASLTEAYGHGADYVEFDVHLSKDNIPVIYHDFVVCLSLKNKGNTDAQRFKVPIRDLKAEQLHKLKVNHHPVKTSPSEESTDSTMDLVDSMDERPFPTLQECFERVIPDIGFNIEIKYRMPLREGGYEEGIQHYTERNVYIDVILKVIMKHANDRRIIFSSFDPDVCTMLRLKQNKYPVLFLCSDLCEAWPPFSDSRTWEVTRSAAFCASERLLGVNVASDNLISKPELVEGIKKLGLVSFCWGWNEETNSKQSIDRVKQLGVDGVIYDKIYDVKETTRNREFDASKLDKTVMLSDNGESIKTPITLAAEEEGAMLGFAGKFDGLPVKDD